MSTDSARLALWSSRYQFWASSVKKAIRSDDDIRVLLVHLAAEMVCFTGQYDAGREAMLIALK